MGTPHHSLPRFASFLRADASGLPSPESPGPPPSTSYYEYHRHPTRRRSLDSEAPLWSQRAFRWDSDDDRDDAALTTTVFPGGGRAVRAGSCDWQLRRAIPSTPSTPNTAPTQPEPQEPAPAPALRHRSGRTSRYLRESDRRAILERIKNGERQADLAKEYQVSRAAISNLKQRRLLRDRLKALGQATLSDTDDSSASASASRLLAASVRPPIRGEFREVSTASMPLLVAKLRQQLLEQQANSSADPSLCRLVQRITRLLLEEALSRCAQTALQAVLVQPQAKMMEDELVFLEPSCSRSGTGEDTASVVVLLATEANAIATAAQRHLLSPDLVDARTLGHSGLDRTPAAATSFVSTPRAKTRTRTRPSPYLTEQARADIMARIRRGEKQADLAKEYNVSRAAITNLKQRRQMRELLERDSHLKRTPTEAVDEEQRGDEVEDARATELLSSTSADVQSSPVATPARRLQLNSAAVKRLLVVLLDPSTPDEAFERAARRHCRLLLEEALGWCFPPLSVPAARFDPISLVFGTHEALLLAREMAHMEPPGPRPARVQTFDDENGLQLTIRVPKGIVHHQPVLVLLDDLLDSIVSPALATARLHDGFGDTGSVSVPALPRELALLLQVLQFHGVAQSQIFLVLSFCSDDFSTQLEQQFPWVNIVASRTGKLFTCLHSPEAAEPNNSTNPVYFLGDQQD
ncbi:hypothetical protein ATCC90586_008740 [Pythium insidiosum]|nr:hypothetical protein ATCC90586_008740 [Pythium insidiosum]